MTQGSHVSLDQLREFARGALPSHLHEEMEQHIDTCLACQSTVNNLEDSGDILIQSLRKALPQDELFSEEEFRLGLKAVRELIDSVPRDLHTEKQHLREEAQKAIGNTISTYRLLEVLGIGGMGVVYKAEHINLKKHFAK